MSMIPSNLRSLFDNHSKIILDLLNAAEVEVDDDFDLDAYRDDIQDELIRLQSCVEELARTLAFEAFAIIQGTEQELLDVVRKIKNPQLRDVLVNDIADKFGISQAFYENCRATKPHLKLKLVKEVIAQSQEPAEVARKFVSEVDKDKFLDSFVELTQALLQPGVKADEWELSNFFSQLSLYLQDQSSIEGAVEHFAAHLNAVWPLIQKLVSYGEGGADDLKARLVKSSLALDCEFLAGLYAVTHSHQVKALGAIASQNPSGKTPFAYLETMGLGLTPEWYNHKQGAADGKYLIVLMTHALVASDVPLNLTQLAANCEPWQVKEYLKGIKSAPFDQPECADKIKQLLGALAEQCQTHVKGPQIRQEIMKSDLPRIVLEPHLTLLGDRFTQELGV